MQLHNGLITLDYNPATDILATTMPDVREFGTEEVATRPSSHTNLGPHGAEAPHDGKEEGTALQSTIAGSTPSASGAELRETQRLLFNALMRIFTFSDYSAASIDKAEACTIFKE